MSTSSSCAHPPTSQQLQSFRLAGRDGERLSAADAADAGSEELEEIQKGASLSAESVSQLASQRRTQLAESLADKVHEANELREVVNGLREQVLGLEAEIKIAWDTVADLAVTSPSEAFGQGAEWQDELFILQGELARRQTEAGALEAMLLEESRRKMALLKQLATATR